MVLEVEEPVTTVCSGEGLMVEKQKGRQVTLEERPHGKWGSQTCFYNSLPSKEQI